MRKRLLDILICPNVHTGNFILFAHELKRNGSTLINLGHDEIEDTDDIVEGFIINRQSKTVYPITRYVLSLLSDLDADREIYIDTLESALKYTSKDYHEVIKGNIDRLKHAERDETGIWNWEEMVYYDREVETEYLRKAFSKNIEHCPLWHIYIERKRYLIDIIPSHLFQNSKTVLEIGCGNARTVSWIFPPSKYCFDYIGTDISLKRLMLAKMVIPEGDFVQCSALNLPFKNEIFFAVISFGVLHHLSNSLDGLASCISKVENGGYILIHEPIEKPRKMLHWGKYHFVNKMFSTYEHSEHDNNINLSDTLKLISHKEMTIEHIYFNSSLLRIVLSRLINLFPTVNRNKFAWKLLIFADNIFIKLFCRRPNRFGPGGVFFALRKR